jgi:hypothetical protein
MHRKLCASVLLLATGLVGAGACSSSNIVAGEDIGGALGGFTTGWACACPNASATCSLLCPDGTTGTCQGGQPFCDIQVGEAGWACACPQGRSACTLTCPDGTAGECSNGHPVCGQADSGACCPAGYDLYACTFADGGTGQACHNPAMGCASSTTCGLGCDPVVNGRCGEDAGGIDASQADAPLADTGADAALLDVAVDASAVDACPGLGCFPNCPNGVLKDKNGCDTCQCAPTGLQWYTTCGYPVCSVPPDGGLVDAGAGCPPIGSACSQQGATCGTPSQANCGVHLVCASQDPKGGPGGCPISTRKYKEGIAYVDDAALKALHDEALGLRLATYRYAPQVADPGPTHLGFIIEDSLQTPAVDRAHDRVDMYGYVSMVVAGMQVQEKEIAELRRELSATRRELSVCRSPGTSTTAR